MELDPSKQQMKRTAPGPIQTNVEVQHRQPLQQAQPVPGVLEQVKNGASKGALQPSAPAVSTEVAPARNRQNGHGAVGNVTTPTAQAQVQQGGQPLNVSLHGSLGIQVNQQTVVPPTGGVAIPGEGGGLLTTTTPSSMLSNSLGNSVGLAAGHMTSHDQADDSVFSPGIVDDERMKLLERVKLISCISMMYKCVQAWQMLV